MSLPRKKLPIGIQNLREIREGGYYYVDKTPHALRMIEQGKYYFLSRPRRFGKSLFLDTLKELFEGNRELFTGLEAETRWNWSRCHPVIRISFGDGVFKSRRELEAKIREVLSDEQTRLGVVCTHETTSGIFSQLIAKTREAHGRRVVLLVDEYDKPILDNIENDAVALEMREGLKDIYSVIKGADPHLEFVLLTGVSKFSKVSLFSGLNNLRDLTLVPQYSSLCGYTDSDLDTVFAPELAPGDLDRTQIREWYNGYNWTGEAVYNPFDLLLLFAERQFRAFWYETATPSFLLRLLKRRRVFLPELGRLLTDASLLGTFDVDNIPTEALMFQTGYLTIEKETNLMGNWEYLLRYPNREVQQSLNGNLLLDWLPEARQGVLAQSRLAALLLADDLVGIGAHIRAFYASLPGEWFMNNPIARYEGYYASVFYALFASLGLEIRVEASSNPGRLDMAVRFQGRVYLFEFKVVEAEADGSALRQIREKDYAAPYRGTGETLHLIGVEFSKTRRALVAWNIETL